MAAVTSSTLHLDSTVRSTPRRAVRYSTDGANGSFRVSGSSARLAGSTDLAKTYAHTGDDLVEPAVYRELPHPTLLIYPLEPELRGESQTPSRNKRSRPRRGDGKAQEGLGGSASRRSRRCSWR